MNQFDGPRVYNFSVHRTYDKNSPWFASIDELGLAKLLEVREVVEN